MRRKALSVSPKRIDGLQLMRLPCRMMAGMPLAFSIPKADRWAAARRSRITLSNAACVFQYPQSGSMGCSLGSVQFENQARSELSVSPKRIDGLQPFLSEVSKIPNIIFQYPQSGSMGCSEQGRIIAVTGLAPFSIPKADRWAAATETAYSAVVIDSVLSVSPKRIDGLQRHRYWLGWGEHSGAFSIPKADRWAAAALYNALERVIWQLFQYPQSGSMGCSPSVRDYNNHRRSLSVSPKRIDGLQPRSLFRYERVHSVFFQYPQSGSMGCSIVRAIERRFGHEAFSIPKADRWAAA